MSKSTPADLAISFRSLPRRLREASGDDAPASSVQQANAAVAAALQVAAQIMNCVPQAADIGRAIDDRHIDDWTDADIDRLQAQAQAAAKAIRDLENLAAD